MAVKIELKRSSVPGKIPELSQLDLGELAINTYDGKVFLKQDTGVSQSIVELASTSGSVASASYAAYAALAGTASYAVFAQQAQSASYATFAQQAQSASYSISSSYAVSSSFATSASYAISASHAPSSLTASYAISASHAETAETASSADDFKIRGGLTGSTATFASSITASSALIQGTITAQTLVVQTISSSVIYSSGSNIFGDELTDVQQFTGSVNITGSLTINGPATFNGSTNITSLTGSLFGTASWANNAINANTASVAPAYTLTSSFTDFTASYYINSASFSSSISGLSSSFLAFSQSYNTGSFTGSFTGVLIGTASWAVSSSLAQTASLAILAPAYTTTASFNQFSSSYYIDSASFNNSISLLSSSFLTTSASYVSASSSLSTRVTTLENASASFAQDSGSNSIRLTNLESTASVLIQASASFSSSIALLSGSFTSFSSSYLIDSASWNNSINLLSQSFLQTSQSLSASIQLLSSSFIAFSQSYSTGSFTGSFNGQANLTGSFTGKFYGDLSGSFSGSVANIGGATNYIARFNTPNSVDSSVIYQSASHIAINETSFTSGNPEALYVFQTNPTSINVVTGKGNTNNYLQLNIQNTNQGVQASSDIVATANNGNENSNYIDMGINSENFNTNFIGSANDAYVYSIANNLHIGNAATNGSHLGLFVGGTDVEANNKLQLNAVSKHIMSGSLDITGSLSVQQGVTSSLFGTASWAISASYVQNAQSASYVLQAVSASYALSASSAVQANTASYVLQAVSASFASNASTASYVLNVVSASYAATASSADDFFVRQNITASNALIYGSLTAQTIYAQYITASTELITGSTKFGTQLTNTHQFTGSVTITGSLSLNNDPVVTQTPYNNFSQSIQLRATNLESTASVLTSASASFAQDSGSNSVRLTNLESTASVLTAASASFALVSGSYAAASQSLSTRTTNLESTASILTAASASFATVSGSYSSASSSLSTRTTNLESTASILTAASASFAVVSSSFATTSGSLSTRTTNLELTASVLTTASASFAVVSGSYSSASGSLSTRVTTLEQASASFAQQSGSNSIRLTNLESTASVLTAASASFALVSASYSAFSQSYTTGSFTGSFTGRGNLTGSLFGTSSWASNAVTSSYILQAVSASFATTSSYTISSSYANNADLLDGKDSSTFATTGSNVFIGNQTVTGSLSTSGSNTLIGSTALTGSLSITGSTVQTGNNTLTGNTSLSGSIIISGSFGTPTPSVRVYGDTQHSGYIRFDPVTTNINTSISASYIYVSGSTNDLYFSQNGSGYNNVTRLRWLEGNLYTGLLNGGLITSQSSTVYQVSSGSGIIVNLNASYTDNPYPVIQYLNWGNLSASIAPLTASYQQAFIGIDSTNNIYAQGIPFSNGQFDNIINIGNVLFQNQSTINGVKTQPSTAYGFEQAQNVFNRAFGPLKLSGYTLAPSGSSTGSLIVGSGTAYAPGSNYAIDPNEPYYTVDSGTNVSKIFRYYQSGSTWVYNTNAGAGFTAIDPTRYSNNGVLTNVPSPVGSNWTIQRAFWYPNSVTKAVVVYYGNAYYGSESEAIANINIEPFVEAPNTAANAIYLGSIIINGDGVFTQPDDFTIVPGGLFRQVGGSGGGGSLVTQTLAGLSDVSISGPTNGQPLVYKSTSGKWENSSTLTADLTGNASTATTSSFAVTASYVLQALSSSFATTASYVQNAQSASYVLNAISASYAATASSADNFVVRQSITASNALITGTLTAQTIIAQTITSSTDFVTGSTKFGSLLTNTHQFTGSVSITGSLTLPYLTTGSVLFAGATDDITEDNTNFFWDNINKRLGVGTNAPVEKLDVNGYVKIIGNGGKIYATNSAAYFIELQSSGGNTVKINGFNGIDFQTGIGSQGAKLFSTNNLLLQNGGTFSDTGNRLQVSGSSYFSDSVGIGSTTLTANGLRVSKTITGGTIANNIFSDGTIQSDVTSQAFYYRSLLRTQAATFNVADVYHYFANGGTLGTNSTVTNQYGFLAENGLTQATNNFGFYGNIAAATGRWNLYMNGTANNYLEGDTLIGTTTAGTATKFTLGGNETAASAIARAALINTTLIAAANNDVLVGLDINPTFSTGAFTGINRISARINGISIFGQSATGNVQRADLGINIVGSLNNSAIGVTSATGTLLNIENSDSTNNSYANVNLRVDAGGNAVYSNISLIKTAAGLGSLRIHQQGTQQLALFTNSNLLLQNGGTFTDNGYRLQVSGPGASGSLWVSGSSVMTGSLIVTQGITGSLFGTSSWAQNAVTSSYILQAVSASFASTASFVNTLNQSVIITGSLTVGTGSIGASENTLTLAARDTGGEGGQLGLNASGGTYTSASMIDNYQNKTRLLRGSNAGSDAEIASWNMHTKQMSLPAYNSSTAFTGTAVANLSVDSGGNILTTAIGSSLTGGATNYIARWASSTTLTTGSLFDNGTNVGVGNISPSYKLDVTGDIRATNAIYANANGAMYFRGGDDAELWDINISNTLGVYGQQNQDRAGIKLGSSGPTLFGSGSNLGIGTITPTLATLQVNGNVWANSFTGSLLGTATTASYVLNAVSASFAATASSADNFLIRQNATASNLLVNNTITAQTLVVQTVTSSIVYSSGSNIFGNQLTNVQQFTGSLRVTGSGNHYIMGGSFGVGTTSPSYKLTVDGDSSEGAIGIERDTVGTNTVIGALNFTNNNAGNVYGRVRGGRNAAGDGYVSLGTGAGDSLYALEGGNIGINTISPAYKLTVAGDANITANLTATGSIKFPSLSSANQTNIVGYNTATGQLFYQTTSSLSVTTASYAATSSYATNFTIQNQLIFDQTLTDYASVASSVVGSNNLFTQATASYTSAFFKYTVSTGSNARTGEMLAVWNGSSVQYTDNSTLDIGSTTPVTCSVSVVGGDVQFNVQTNTSGWRIKSIGTFM